jgi:ABC-2 type transport system permease protein
MSLTLTYTKLQLIEAVRTPVSFLTLTITPVAVMIFFLVPYIGDDPVAMTGATATMVVFAVMLCCVGHFSVSIAALRESTFGAYLRTLPGGLAPQVISNLLTGMAIVVASLVPIILVAALFTAATATPAQLLAAAAALLVSVVTFTMMGMAIGFLLSLRATILTTSLLLLPLAVGGGMFFDPAERPALIEAISPFLPTRGANELVIMQLGEFRPSTTALIMLGIWTITLAGLTVWGYRRDEDRRFG